MISQEKMNNQEIHLLSKTIKLLDEINHPDSYRIAKEICNHTNYNIDENIRIIQRLKTGEPWEYIRGWAEFDGLKLIVNRDTLIPRLETLEILDLVKDCIQNDIKEIIDIGSGSGAIGLALAKRYPKLNITLVEKYNKTLKVLKVNTTRFGFKNTRVIQSDLLDSYYIEHPSIVIANLPYIPTNDYINLDKSVKDFEPKEALDGGKDGLNIIKKLIKQVEGNSLIKCVILEIDPKQKSILNKMDLKFKKVFIKDFRGLFRFLKLYR